MLTILLLFFAPFFNQSNSGCEINNVTYIKSNCDVDGNFDILFDLNHSNASDSFRITAENIAYGTFAYTDLPITVLNAPGDGLDRTFHFQDIENPNCTTSKKVLGTDCNSQNGCSISEVTYNNGSCQDDGTYSIFLNFTHENTGESFKVYHGNNFLGQFDYADLPVELTGIPGVGQYVTLLIKDAENTSCHIYQDIPAQSCPGFDECDLSELVLTRLECNDNNQFNVKINFDHINTGDEFVVYANGVNMGIYNYADLPVITGPYNGLINDDYEFLIKDVIETSCNITGSISGPYCGNGNDCDIMDLSIDLGGCNNEDKYTLYLNFEHENTSSSYKLFIDNNYIGTYDYADLPLEYSGLLGDGQQHTIMVKDLNNSSCYQLISYTAPDCVQSGCQLSNLELYPLECDDNDQFMVKINFDHQNTSGSFKVYAANNVYGSFSYDELPITIGPFDGNTDNSYNFLVKDSENSTCATEMKIHAPYCSQTDCSITGINYQLSECDDDGNYKIYFDLEYENTSDSFYVYVMNNNLGLFAYADLPGVLGPFEGNGNTYAYYFKDQENPDCSKVKEIKGKDCNNNGNCDLSEMTITKLECNDNNEFKVKINFNHSNTGGSFKITANGIDYGTFNYNQLPVIIGPFDGNVSTNYNFVVRDIEFPDCMTEGILAGPYCDDNQCSIYGIQYEFSDCDTAGKYSIHFNLDYENTSDSFKIIRQNELLGVFAYVDLPVIVGPFTGDGNTTAFFFQDILQPNCAKVKEIKGPDCNNSGECELGNLNIWKLECNENNEFNVKINFDHQNTGSEFTIQGNGQNYGTFNYDDLPVIIGPFDGSGNNIYEFIIKDLSNPDCKISGSLSGPYCDEDECNLYDIAYNLGGCDENDNYKIYLNVQNEFASDSFNLIVNNSFYGKYAYADMPVEVGPLPGDGQNVKYLFKDSENSECYVSKEIKAPQCGENNECQINELTALPSNCDNEGSFFVEINFDHMNVSDSFKIQGNGVFYGYFSYDDLPVVLGPFDGNTDQTYEFLVKDQLDADCNEVATIAGPHCGNGFEDPVMNLSISNIICIDENSYYADLNINHELTDNILLKLWEANQLLGEYYSNTFPVTVVLKDDQLPRIKISEASQPANFAIGIYEHPDCILSTDSYDASKVQCYPNPTSGGLNVVWPDQQFSYKIISINGNLINSGTGFDKKVLDVEHVIPGSYYIQLNNGKSVTVRRFNKI